MVPDELPTLAAALDAEAAELDGVEATATAAGTEWRVGGTAIAELEGDTAQFRLSPAVATAALRTPGTSPSARGAGWVAFRPEPIDGHALDRAVAWLASAARRAAAER